jgi:glycosyltransferase involved in cell wall biosynthesis
MSLRDAEIIRAVSPRVPSTIVPPGVDRELLAPRPRRPGPGRVLYLGQMEHFPNLDGLLFLYREIWPRVRRADPEAHLTVAGRGAREELARVAPQTLAAIESDQSVDLAGFVPDLQATMDLTAVMAAPLRLGSGVRTKVIEAMAAGLPLVTTTRGAEGLAVAHERELLIADEPEQFARELVHLLRDPELQARLSRAGRELAAREHDNDQLAARLERALMAAAGSVGRACLACPPQDGEARR